MGEAGFATCKRVLFGILFVGNQFAFVCSLKVNLSVQQCLQQIFSIDAFVLKHLCQIIHSHCSAVLLCCKEDILCCKEDIAQALMLVNTT